MRLKNILIPVLLTPILASCSKDITPHSLSFSVSSLNTARQVSTSFHVGDTVNFVFSGNPDQITFFSGEPGYQYQNRTRTTDPTNIDTLKFTNSVTATGTSSLQLLVSTTFSKYTQVNSVDSTNVLATYPTGWTDISNRATWSSGNGSVTTKVSLNDYAAAGKPIFLAFRYTAPAGAAQSSWTINGLGLRHYTSGLSYCVDSNLYIVPTSFPTTTVSPGWGVVSVANPAIKFTLDHPAANAANTNYSLATGTTNTKFTATGNSSAASALATETWVISGPVNLNQVLPDGGVSIKDMTTNASTSLYSSLSTWANYAYKFKKAGTYAVTFLAATSSVDGQNSEVKTITITVQ